MKIVTFAMLLLSLTLLGCTDGDDDTGPPERRGSANNDLNTSPRSDAPSEQNRNFQPGVDVGIEGRNGSNTIPSRDPTGPVPGPDSGQTAADANAASSSNGGGAVSDNAPTGVPNEGNSIGVNPDANLNNPGGTESIPNNSNPTNESGNSAAGPAGEEVTPNDG